MRDPPDAGGAPRPTRALTVVSVFLVGAFPPVIWAALWLLERAPAAVVLPLAALAGMTASLFGLWRPAPGGWVGSMVIFGIGAAVSAPLLVLSVLARDVVLGPWHAASLAHHGLAFATLLAMRRRWSAWAEPRFRRPPEGKGGAL